MLFGAVGLKLEAQQALQRHHAACAAAAQELQHAAEAGSHAAFAAAAAAAARFSVLHDTCNSCAQCFKARQEAAMHTLHAAAAALPLQQVQSAVDVALQLGVCRKDLTAALDAARARDGAAASRLSDDIRALLAGSTSALGDSCRVYDDPAAGEGSTAAAAAGATGAAVAANSSCPGCMAAPSSFDFESLMDAVAACRQYGKTAEAAAAEAVLLQCREAAAAQLAQQAEHSQSAASVQRMVSWCNKLAGLQQECNAAADMLKQRQQKLAKQLRGLRDSASCDLAATQLLLHKARTLHVPAEDVAAAEQLLQELRTAAMRNCWDAAGTGTLQDFQHAAAAAVQHGIGAEQLQQCRKLMHSRQQEAARLLAGSAAGLCSSLLHSSHAPDINEALMPHLAWLLHDSHCTKVSEDSSSSSKCMQTWQQDLLVADTLAAQVRELQHSADVCNRLGLQVSVAKAVQAVIHALLMVHDPGATCRPCCTVCLGHSIMHPFCLHAVLKDWRGNKLATSTHPGWRPVC